MKTCHKIWHLVMRVTLQSNDTGFNKIAKTAATRLTWSGLKKGHLVFVMHFRHKKIKAVFSWHQNICIDIRCAQSNHSSGFWYWALTFAAITCEKALVEIDLHVYKAYRCYKVYTLRQQIFQNGFLPPSCLLPLANLVECCEPKHLLLLLF